MEKLKHNRDVDANSDGEMVEKYSTMHTHALENYPQIRTDSRYIIDNRMICDSRIGRRAPINLGKSVGSPAKQEDGNTKILRSSVSPSQYSGRWACTWRSTAQPVSSRSAQIEHL